MKHGFRWARLAGTAALVAFAGAASAQIKVGITLAATGPGASLGIPQKNTIALLPKTVAGQTIEYIVLDDGSDTTTAVKNTRKFISEDHVDAVVGSSLTPSTLAMIDVAAEEKVPLVSMAASSRIVEPVDEKRHWVFKTPQNDSLMASAIAEHMASKSYHTVAFIGFSDSYGDGWFTEFNKAAGAHGITVSDRESFARQDQSVTPQILKILATNPQAVLIAGSGTPAALPEKTLRERGYKGPIYQTHGVANNDFLRVCGADCEGTVLPAGPVLVAAQLPDSNPSKKVAIDYIHAYEAAYGAGSVSTFGAHLYDAILLLQQAIPQALKSAQPGTPAFRLALRDALEHLTNYPITHGVVNMSPTDHSGLDQRARVMVTISQGKWVLIH